MSASTPHYPVPGSGFNGQTDPVSQAREQHDVFHSKERLSSIRRLDSGRQSRFTPLKLEGGFKSRFTYHFKREQLYGYAPILSVTSAIAICGIGCLFFLGFGIVLVISSNSYIECRVNYEDKDVLEGGTRYETIPIDSQKCGNGAGLTELPGPKVYVYYEMEGFYQNDAQIVWSRSDRQLAGEIITDPSQLTECGDKLFEESSTEKKRRILHPCGIMAWNVFTDKFQFYETPPDTMRDLNAIPMSQDRESVVWEADRLRRYRNPPEADRLKNREDVYFWMSVVDNDDGDPHETTPEETISLRARDSLVYSEAGEMVENSHFIEWMRTSAFPNQRKFYGILKGPLKLPVYAYIAVNFDVKRWGGKKALVLVQPSILGGQTLFLGVCYLVLATLLFLFCLCIFLKHRRDQREEPSHGDIRWQVPMGGKKKTA